MLFLNVRPRKSCVLTGFNRCTKPGHGGRCGWRQEANQKETDQHRSDHAPARKALIDPCGAPCGADPRHGEHHQADQKPPSWNHPPRHEEGKKHVQAEATITGWTQQAFSGLRCIRPRPPLMDEEVNANHHGQHHQGRQPIEHGLQHVLRPTNVQACGLRGRNEVGPCR